MIEEGAGVQEDEYNADDLGYADEYGDDPEAYYEVYDEEDFDPYDDEDEALSPEEERVLLEGCSLEELREMCAEAELDSSGDRETLLDRLQQAMRDEEAEEAEMRGRQVMAAVRSADADEATALGAAAAAPVASALNTNMASAHWGTPDPIGVATLEAAAVSPEADPVAYARLEAYVVAWATHETPAEKYATHKWVRHMRRGIRIRLCTPHDHPMPPEGGSEREGGARPALMDEDALLRCLERMGEEGRLPAGEAGVKLAAATAAFRERQLASAATARAATATADLDDEAEGRGDETGRGRGGSVRQSGDLDVTCSNCGARGHTARDCPSPPRRMAMAAPSQGGQRRRQQQPLRLEQGRGGRRPGFGDGLGDGEEWAGEDEEGAAAFGFDDGFDDAFDGPGSRRYDRGGRDSHDDRGGRGGDGYGRGSPSRQRWIARSASWSRVGHRGAGDGGYEAGYGHSHRGGRGVGHARGGGDNHYYKEEEDGGLGLYDDRSRGRRNGSWGGGAAGAYRGGSGDLEFEDGHGSRRRRPPHGGGGDRYSPHADRVCYNCGRRGHIAVHCPFPRRDHASRQSRG